MPNNNYEAGRQFEYRCMRELRKKGRYVVTRAAGSHGPIDIWAVGVEPGTHRLLLIQCKKTGKLPLAERNIIVRVAEIAGGLPIMTYCEKGTGRIVWNRLHTDGVPDEEVTIWRQT